MVAGFAHAPITKGLIIIVSITSVLASLFQLKPFLHLQLDPHIYTHHQWYRLLTQHFAFTNSSELLLALLLLYNAGVKVERTFGTYKFASFLAVVTAMYTAVQMVVLGVGSMVVSRYAAASEGSRSSKPSNWIAAGQAPAGPFALVFAMLYQHHRIIPHLFTFQVSHLTLTDQHVQVYSLALLLSLSQSSRTLFASILGIGVSAVYRSTELSRYRIPLRLYRILSLLLKPWIGETRVPQRSWRAEPPVRRTLQARQARQARLAEHTAAVANTSGGMASARVASLLRRRTATAAAVPVAVAQGQGQGGQQRPERVRPPEAAVAGTAWNDAPPPEARSGADGVHLPSHS